MVNDAIAYAAAHDVLIVAAAGNNGRDIDTVAYYPSALDNAGRPFETTYVLVLQGATARNSKSPISVSVPLTFTPRASR